MATLLLVRRIENLIGLIEIFELVEKVKTELEHF